MFSQDKQTQRTFEQAYYVPILAETFLTAKRAEGRTPASIAFYREKLNIFLAFCDAQAVTQIQELSADFLRRFLLAMSETHNPGGIHAIYRAVRAFLRFVEVEEVYPGWQSPTKKVKAPRVEIQPIEPVSLEDVSALLATCPRGELIGARDHAILLCLLDTGARVTEFLACDLADVDPTGAVLLKHTKGKRPRYVYLSQKSRRALRAYVRMRRDKSSALWITKQAERLTYDGLRAILTRRAKLAGLKEIPSAHDFRRAFALNFLRSGGDIFSLARLLGHTSINVLKRYLAQTDQDAQLAHVQHSPVDRLR